MGWETRYSDDGLKFRIWRPPLPRISDSVLHCTFFVYDSLHAAESGEPSGASGFVAGVPSDEFPEKYFHYAITNKHVIREGETVLRFNTRERATPVKTYKDDWLLHPDGDDVAATAVELPPEIYFNRVPTTLFLSEEDAEKYKVGPGDETVLIGRFASHEGRQFNLPSARFGNISMLPWEPVKHPSGRPQESFLVECRSLPGYSGSPVFLDAVPHQRVDVRTRQQVPPFCLLGIDWGHLPRFAPVLRKDRKTRIDEGWVVEMNSGMACVLPAWKITELLEEDRFKMQRKQAEKDLQKQPSAVLDSSDEPAREPTQTTDQGYEIPVPTKAKVLGDIGKASRKKK